MRFADHRRPSARHTARHMAGAQQATAEGTALSKGLTVPGGTRWLLRQRVSVSPDPGSRPSLCTGPCATYVVSSPPRVGSVWQRDSSPSAPQPGRSLLGRPWLCESAASIRFARTGTELSFAVSLDAAISIFP